MCREGGAHHHGRIRVKVRVWPPVMVLGMSPAARELVSLAVLGVGRACCGCPDVEPSAMMLSLLLDAARRIRIREARRRDDSSASVLTIVTNGRLERRGASSGLVCPFFYRVVEWHGVRHRQT